MRLCSISQHDHPPDDGSFAVLIELRDDQAPSVTHGQVSACVTERHNHSLCAKNLPPWIPAARPHTTRGASDNAELHMVRSVDTGIINVSENLRCHNTRVDKLNECSCHFLFKNQKQSSRLRMSTTIKVKAERRHDIVRHEPRRHARRYV